MKPTATLNTKPRPAEKLTFEQMFDIPGVYRPGTLETARVIVLDDRHAVYRSESGRLIAFKPERWRGAYFTPTDEREVVITFS